MRIGFGYDTHRLGDDAPLVLGGVRISHDTGLVGHSDADVLLHAISDAILGAAALGDLGTHFPDTDDEWAGADSRRLLRIVVDRVSQAGYVPHNVDATVVIERPKLRPHIDKMRDSVADCLQVSETQVSVKATTNEGVGPVGRGEAAVAHAVCILHSS